MKKSSYLATWVQRSILFGVLPTVIGLRFLSWGKITMNKMYLQYAECAQANLLDPDIEVLPFLGKSLYFIIESIPAVCLLLALYYFSSILNLYKKNLYFTAETVQLLKKTSIVMLTWAVYQLFFDTFATLIISLFKPEGQRCIRISFGTDNIIHFFVVLVLFVLLHVVREAYKIKSEQDLVV